MNPRSTLTFIDSHCHLEHDFEGKTPLTLVQEAQNAGVCDLMTIGTDLPSLSRLPLLAHELPHVWFALGIHPHEAKDWVRDDGVQARQLIMDQIHNPKFKAVGEIGLDYFYKHSDPQDQKRALREQCQLAREIQKPIVIHSREAEDDLIQILKEHTTLLGPDRLPGVIHCFTGTKSFAHACIDLGFFISFSGIVTFKKAEEVRDVAKSIPLSKLLIETDAPFLAPVPYRGKKCEPSMVVETAKHLAQILNVDIARLAEQTTANAKTLFNIP